LNYSGLIKILSYINKLIVKFIYKSKEWNVNKFHYSNFILIIK